MAAAQGKKHEKEDRIMGGERASVSLRKGKAGFQVITRLRWTQGKTAGIKDN